MNLARIEPNIEVLVPLTDPGGVQTYDAEGEKSIHYFAGPLKILQCEEVIKAFRALVDEFSPTAPAIVLFHHNQSFFCDIWY